MDGRSLLERFILTSLTDEACPAPDQLAAYILGMLDSNVQLQVAAHTRTCPMCQEELALARPPIPRQRRLIAQLIPTFTAGVRGHVATSFVRHYQAADLVVELTLAPPQGDYWRVTGQALRQQVGVPNLTIMLRAGRRRAYQTMSDSAGFFTFEDLPAGDYTLSVVTDQTLVQVRGLSLHHDNR